MYVCTHVCTYVCTHTHVTLKPISIHECAHARARARGRPGCGPGAAEASPATTAIPSSDLSRCRAPVPALSCSASLAFYFIFLFNFLLFFHCAKTMRHKTCNTTATTFSGSLTSVFLFMRKTQYQCSTHSAFLSDRIDSNPDINVAMIAALAMTTAMHATAISTYLRWSRFDFLTIICPLFTTA